MTSFISWMTPRRRGGRYVMAASSIFNVAGRTLLRLATGISSIRVTAFNCVRRITERVRIGGGSRRDFPVAKNGAVSRSAKERITEAL